MKSERRHNLETNELAVQVQEFADRIKPYASQIALVIVGLLVVAFLASNWKNATSRTEQNAWDEYLLASYSTDPELNSMKLLAENEEFAGTPVPEWAYLAWADRQVLLASQTYLVDRDSTMKRLESAEVVFKNLAQGSTSPQVKDRARYGLAQVLEMQGKTEEAREAYDKVDGVLVTLAEGRAEQLEAERVQEAAQWLATADLPKRETPSTSSTTSGLRPNFDEIAPPLTPGIDPFNESRSLEEILSTSPGTSNETGRYGEEQASGEAVPAGETESPAVESATEESATEEAEPGADESAEADNSAGPRDDATAEEETEEPSGERGQ